MLTPEQKIQEIANNIRPDQSLDYNFNILSSIASQNLKIEYTSDAISTEVTGTLDIANRTITLSPLHKTNASATYCLSYFFGAAILFEEKEISSISATKNTITTTYTGSCPTIEKAIEHSISIFTKSLLMPEKLTTRIIQRLIEDFDIKDHMHGIIYLDYQECNHNQYVKIVNNICSIMNVSSELAITRLTELKILNDVRLVKPKIWSSFVSDPGKDSGRNTFSPQRVKITIGH